MTKNKFAHPPYLPEFNGLKAAKLRRILSMLEETCCSFESPRGALKRLEQLISRPSTIRKCDVSFLLPVVEAINRLEQDDHSDLITAKKEALQPVNFFEELRNVKLTENHFKSLLDNRELKQALEDVQHSYRVNLDVQGATPLEISYSQGVKDLVDLLLAVLY